MSVNLTKPLTLMHLIVGLTITIVGGAFTAGAAWTSTTNNGKNLEERVVREAEAVKSRVDKVEAQRAADVQAAKEERERLGRDVNDIKWIVVRMAQKSGVDTSRLEN